VIRGSKIEGASFAVAQEGSSSDGIY